MLNCPSSCFNLVKGSLQISKVNILCLTKEILKTVLELSLRQCTKIKKHNQIVFSFIELLKYSGEVCERGQEISCRILLCHQIINEVIAFDSCLYVCLPVYLSVCLSTCPSVCKLYYSIDRFGTTMIGMKNHEA